MSELEQARHEYEAAVIQLRRKRRRYGEAAIRKAVKDLGIPYGSIVHLYKGGEFVCEAEYRGFRWTPRNGAQAEMVTVELKRRIGNWRFDEIKNPQA